MRVLLKIPGKPEAWFLAELNGSRGKGRVKSRIGAGRYSEAIILALAGGERVRQVGARTAGSCRVDLMLSESGARWDHTRRRPAG